MRRRLQRVLFLTAVCVVLPALATPPAVAPCVRVKGADVALSTHPACRKGGLAALRDALRQMPRAAAPAAPAAARGLQTLDYLKRTARLIDRSRVQSGR
jgi:hypothetical protein